VTTHELLTNYSQVAHDFLGFSLLFWCEDIVQLSIPRRERVALAILAICILGCDIATYMLFEYVHGYNHRTDFCSANAIGGTPKVRRRSAQAESEF
jgi:hypothetical protein